MATDRAYLISDRSATRTWWRLCPRSAPMAAVTSPPVTWRRWP